VARYLNFDHKGNPFVNFTSSALLPNYCIQINVDEWMKQRVKYSVLFGS
jgi:hypothetical protein